MAVDVRRPGQYGEERVRAGLRAWGDFRGRPVELDRVWYVPGADLAGWLRSRVSP